MLRITLSRQDKSYIKRRYALTRVHILEAQPGAFCLEYLLSARDRERRTWYAWWPSNEAPRFIDWELSRPPHITDKIRIR